MKCLLNVQQDHNVTELLLHRDPRTQRQPYSETPRRQSRLSSRPTQAPQQQPEASSSASVPILDTKPLPAYRRRDADGGMGEAPPPEREQVTLPLQSPILSTYGSTMLSLIVFKGGVLYASAVPWSAVLSSHKVLGAYASRMFVTLLRHCNPSLRTQVSREAFL